MTPNKDFISKSMTPKLWAITEERVTRATPQELDSATKQYANKTKPPIFAIVLAAGLVVSSIVRDSSRTWTVFICVLAILVLGIRYIIMVQRPRYIVMSQYAWYFYENDQNFRAAIDQAK